ncbi:MAG: hypothetical protein WCW27_04690 [Patescibacteria group bacterium]|jgi:hypothetical protein
MWYQKRFYCLVVSCILIWPIALQAMSVTVDTDDNTLEFTNDTTVELTFPAAVNDIQALPIKRNNLPYLVVATWQDKTITLSLYNSAGQIISTETIAALKEDRQFTVMRLEYKLVNDVSTIQLRAVKTNNERKPKKYLKKQYIIDLNNADVIQLYTSNTEKIAYSEHYFSDNNDEAGMDYFNWERLSAGLLSINRKTSIDKRCALHTEYMRLNDEITHYEKPFKKGYTKDGYQAGTQSDLTGQFNTSLTNGVDILTTAIYHRIPMLRNNLYATGWAVSDFSKQGYRYGCLTVYAPEGWYTTSTMLTSNKYNTPAFNPDNHEPILYPGIKQTHVPVDFITGETPDPLANVNGTYPAGYPISLIFAWYDIVTDSNLKLFLANGEKVTGYFQAPNDSNDPNSASQQNSLIFIPEKPLAYDTTYTVKASGKRNGVTFSKQWQFTTEPYDENYPYAE